MTSQSRIAAEDYLEALAAHGIEHLFVNPGTDFAPIVEAFARAARSNRRCRGRWSCRTRTPPWRWHMATPW